MDKNLNNIVNTLVIKRYKDKEVIRYLKENNEIIYQRDLEGKTLIHLIIKKVIDKSIVYENKKYNLIRTNSYTNKKVYISIHRIL